MENFKIGVFDGQELWYSRSIAVTLFAFAKDKNGNIFVLANKRGKGTPNNQGKWNCPCGYLDFNETTKEAAIRETFEETGVKIDKKLVHFISFNSNPKSEGLQNVTIKYAAMLPKTIDFYEQEFSKKNNEEDEVSAIAFISLNDLSKYNWAFNNKKLIKDNWLKMNSKKRSNMFNLTINK